MVQNMKKNNSIKDYNILIYNNNSLSLNDIKTLNLLYAPLMGALSLQIYLTFSSLTNNKELGKDTFTHEEIFDILNTNETDFIQARNKLEALGLLETYTDSFNYYYCLLMPQRASSFIKSGVLGIYLNSKIGSNNLKKILANFKQVKIDTNSLTNITKTFDQVFEVRNDSTNSLKDVDLNESNSKTVNLKSSFEIDDVINNIDTSYIKTSVDEFKNYLSNIEAVYQISKDELITIYNQSIKNDEFSKQTFIRKVKLIYEKNNKNNNIVFEVKDDSKDDVVTPFEEVSAKELLDKENLYTLKNVNLIAEIYNIVPYSRAITNMMIYSVITKLHELPKAGYFEAMYNTMQEHNITTGLDAYNYLFTDQSDKKVEKKTYKRVSKNKDNNPEWAIKAQDDILKGFNKVTEDE